MSEDVEFKKIAFMVGNEVFYVMHIPQVPEFTGVYEGMLSGPTLVDVTHDDFFVEAGARLIDGEFYVPVSKFKANQIQEPDYEVE
jgi:hypothetical protein